MKFNHPNRRPPVGPKFFVLTGLVTLLSCQAPPSEPDLTGSFAIEAVGESYDLQATQDYQDFMIAFRSQDDKWRILKVLGLLKERLLADRGCSVVVRELDVRRNIERLTNYLDQAKRKNQGVIYWSFSDSAEPEPPLLACNGSPLPASLQPTPRPSSSLNPTPVPTRTPSIRPSSPPPSSPSPSPLPSATYQFLPVTSLSRTLTVTFRDNQAEDGDIIRVDLNGTVLPGLNSLYLRNAGRMVTLNLAPGLNVLRVTALNTGSSGPNTVEITFPTTQLSSGPRRQVSRGLLTGGTQAMAISAP